MASSLTGIFFVLFSSLNYLGARVQRIYQCLPLSSTYLFSFWSCVGLVCCSYFPLPSLPSFLFHSFRFCCLRFGYLGILWFHSVHLEFGRAISHPSPPLADAIILEEFFFLLDTKNGSAPNSDPVSFPLTCYVCTHVLLDNNKSFDSV